MGVVLSLLVAAQAIAAIVSGVVRDTSDAVVPGASVEIRSETTNRSWQTITDSRGRFSLLYLPVGEHHLSVHIAGFTNFDRKLTLAISRLC